MAIYKNKCIIQNCYVADDEAFNRDFCHHINDLKEYATVNKTPLGVNTQLWEASAIQECDIFIAFISPESMNDDRFNNWLHLAIKHSEKIRIFTLRLKPYELKYHPIAKFTQLPTSGFLSGIEDINIGWLSIVKNLEPLIKEICQKKNNEKIQQQVENDPFFQQLEHQLIMDEKYWKKAEFFLPKAVNLTWTYDFLSRHKNALQKDAEILGEKSTKPVVIREALYRLDARLNSLEMLFADINATNHPIYRTVLSVQDSSRSVEHELNIEARRTFSKVLLESELLSLENKLAKLIIQLRLLIDQTPQFGPN